MVAWGDGTTSSAVIDTESLTFTATHIMRDDMPTGSGLDTIAISVAITDDDGGTSTAVAGNIADCQRRAHGDDR